MNTLEIICDYIRREASYTGDIPVDADLLEQHILDSFNIVQLAMFLEERFDLELDPSDVVRENLSSLSRIVALVERKQAGRAQPQHN